MSVNVFFMLRQSITDVFLFSKVRTPLAKLEQKLNQNKEFDNKKKNFFK